MEGGVCSADQNTCSRHERRLPATPRRHAQFQVADRSAAGTSGHAAEVAQPPTTSAPHRISALTHPRTLAN